MARAPQLSEAVRLSVARQIGERMPSRTESLTGEPASLGESFPIFVLPFDEVQRLNNPEDLAPELRLLLIDTGVWHHQIVEGGGASLFARSRDLGGNERLEVQEVVEARSAERIAETVEWIDANAPGRISEDATAVLLLAPAFYLTAFWLTETRDERIVVVERPERLAALETHVFYPVHAFLRVLASQTDAFGLPSDQAQPLA